MPFSPSFKLFAQSDSRWLISSSRSFMRLLNGDTRLLMLDEPTSALDSIAERELFERFREKSRGKTAIFVTHRFANLAKRADLIVYVF